MSANDPVRHRGMYAASPPRAIVVMGPPGSGKSTIASRLAKDLDYVPFLTGQILRRALEVRMLPRNVMVEIETSMAENRPLPVEVFCAVAKSEIAGLCGAGIVIDGFPRSLEQCRRMTEVLACLDIAPADVLGFALQAPPDALYERVAARRVCRSCASPVVPGVPCCPQAEPVARRDDARQTFVARLAEYVAQAPAIEDAFRSRWRLHTISATTDLDVSIRNMVRVVTMKSVG